MVSQYDRQHRVHEVTLNFLRVQIDRFGKSPLNEYFYSEEDLTKECNDQLTVKLVRDIFGDVIFKRLKQINFLGAIGYKHKHKREAKYIGSRYQHSLGVARLALEYANLASMSSKDTRLLVASALLHDIGHAPLSHSLEPVFKENFGINHHDATSKVIQGQSPLGKSISRILKSQGISAEEVICLIDGHSTSQFSALFSGAINIDTIDGILRTLAIFGHKTTTSPLMVVRSLFELSKTDVGVLDEFWRNKNLVYQHCIYQPKMHTLDVISQDFLRNNPNSFSQDCFYKTERQLKKSLPQLFQLIQHYVSLKQNDYPLHYPATKRRFHVDLNVDGLERNLLNSRYCIISETVIADKSWDQLERSITPQQTTLRFAYE